MKILSLIVCCVLLFGCTAPPAPSSNASTSPSPSGAPMFSGNVQEAQSLFDLIHENQTVFGVIVDDVGDKKEVSIMAKPEAIEQCDDIIISAVSGGISVLGEENIGDFTVALVDSNREPLYIFVKAIPGETTVLGEYGELANYVGEKDIISIDSSDYLRVFFAPAPTIDTDGDAVLPVSAIEEGLRVFAESSTNKVDYEYFPNGEIITVYITTTYDGDAKTHNENNELVNAMDEMAHLSFELISLNISAEMLKSGVLLSPPDNELGYYGELFDSHDGTINYISANNEPLASYMLLRSTHDIMAFYA